MPTKQHTNSLSSRGSKQMVKHVAIAHYRASVATEVDVANVKSSVG